jgi:hypothetical protein
MGIDQRIHVAGELCLRQRLDDDIAFPGAIAFGFPMLDRASPASSKMRTKWRDPLRAGALDLQQVPPVGMMTSTVSPPSVYGTYTLCPSAKATPSPR